MRYGAAAWALIFIFYSVLVLTKYISQDEGVFLTIGKYINQGWLPYRDIFDHKPPGIYFLFAGLFNLFSTSVWVIKMALILSTLGVSVFLKKIGDIVKPGTGWLTAGIFMFLMTQFEGFYLIAEPFMLFPLLLSTWLLLRSKRDSQWLVVIGICLAIVILFKQTAVLSVLPLIWLAVKTNRPGRLVCLAGFAAPLLMLGAYLMLNGLVAEAWHQVITLTLTSYPREPIGYVLESLQQNFFWTLPIWLLLLFGLKSPVQHQKIIWALVLIPLPFMFFRHYPHYWVQILPFVALIVAVALAELRSTKLLMAMIIFLVAIAGGKVGQDATTNYQKLQAQLKTAQVLSQEPADILLAENQFTAFYFLLPQRPLNKYLYLTEITEAENAQQKMTADLQRHKNVLILWPDPSYTYATRLEKYVLENGTEQKIYAVLGIRLIRLSR